MALVHHGPVPSMGFSNGRMVAERFSNDIRFCLSNVCAECVVHQRDLRVFPVVPLAEISSLAQHNLNDLQALLADTMRDSALLNIPSHPNHISCRPR